MVFFMSIRSKIVPGGAVWILASLVAVLMLAPLGVATSSRSAQAATVTDWYLAEGYTGAGFQEYVCLGNPGTSPAAATVTFLFNNDAARQVCCTVPAQSRYTVDVNAMVGSGREVSTKVSSSSDCLAVERSLYFVYNGEHLGSNIVRAAASSSQTWYFAEGYTGPGFDEYVCVLNPGGAPAGLTFRFQTPDGERVKTGFVPANSRATFKVNDLLGAGIESSLKLESDRPVIAERPTYFEYRGVGSHNWEGGHCVMGATSLSSSYYFAEGTTRPGFEEWVTLQNAGSRSISVTASYQFGPGQGAPLTKSYQVAANSRSTIYVPGEVGPGKDVSLRLDSESPFLAERPMYFSFGDGGDAFVGGTCSVGAAATVSQWLLAEGYTGPHFEEWLCIQNPSSSASTVSVDYFTQERGALPTRTVTIGPDARTTILVNDQAGAGLSLATMVTVKSGPPVLVERPIYVDAEGNPASGVKHGDPASPQAPLAPVTPVVPDNPVQPTPPAPTPPTPPPPAPPTPAPTPTPPPDPPAPPPPTPPPDPPAPPAPVVMHGMCFSPYLTSWTVTQAQLSSLLDKIKPYSEWIRTFGSEDDWDKVLTLAKSKGFNVAAGADIWNDLTYNQNEVNKLISQVNSGRVDKAVVGDEVLENNALTQDQMISYLRQVRATGAQTSTSQSAYYWLQTPRVIAECDFITMNIYPYWDQVSIDSAISDLDTQYRQLQAIAGGRQIIVETGWPTAGQTNGQAVPSSANAARYLNDFMDWAESKNVDYYYFEAFDESWKAEGGCGAHWGLWGTDANLKPEYSAVLNPANP